MPPVDWIRFVVEMIGLVVGVGYWAGQVKERRANGSSSQTLPASPQNGNGTPTYSEVLRRLELVEHDRRQYLRSGEMKLRDETHRRELDDLWSAVKTLREVDSATQRRIDSLMQQIAEN